MSWIKAHKFWTVVLVIVALVVLSSLGGSDDKSDKTNTNTTSGVESNNSGSHDAADDVVISSCANGEYLADVKVVITNHTSKRSNYMVEITLLDAAGNKVGDGSAFSNNVEAGQTAYEDAFASSTADFTHCKIVSVSRYAA